MAEKDYFRNLKSGTKEFDIVNGAWELMKIADSPELRFLCYRLFDAFKEYGGSLDEIRNIWIEWWATFQTLYENDDSDDYWDSVGESVKYLYDKYNNTEYYKLTGKLSTLIADYQQYRRDNELL